MSITTVIIIITIGSSVWALQNHLVFDKFKFFPAIMGSGNQYYRFFTYGLIHADWLHLAVNMYVLYSFGSNGTEAIYKMAFGTKGVLFFILLYVGGVITSVIPSYEKHKNNPYYTAVGASGAVSAIVFAYILFQPTTSFMFLFIPFPIPAYIFGVGYLLLSYYLAQQNKGNIGHDAHLFGALFGLMFTILLDKQIAVNFYLQIAAAWS